jgi:tight adherence protein B
MLLPIIVFVVATTAIVGGYFAATVLPDRLKQRQVDRRLRELSQPVAQPTEGVSIVLRPDERPFLSRVAIATPGGKWLEALIEQSGVRTTITAVILISIASAITCALIAMILVRHSLSPFVGMAVGSAVPVAFLLRRRSVRRRRFEEMFPEALDLLSRAIKAGHAFQTAMNMVAEELPDPVGPEFKKTFDQQNFGLPLREALNGMAERVQTMDVKFFVTAVLIQRETGGNLSEILDNLAHVVRDRFKVLRQVRVHTAHGRFTGWVLLALPAALAVALSFINPPHMQLLFREPMGQTMLIGAVVMQTIGFFWIKRVIKIEV